MTGTVLVVTSGKGGVGKTTTALNLGVALRGNGHSVALVDGDLGMANLAPMLGIEASATLHDVLAGEVTVEDATLEEADGFGIVPGARDLEAFASIDPDGLPGALSTLAGESEFVVVDAGPGVHYESTLPIEAADEVVLVTTPANTSIEDTRKVAELAGMMDCTVRGAVVNRATDGTDPEGIAADLGVDLLAVVPEDPAVGESTDAGVPMERHAPESPAAGAYRRLADVLAGVGGSADPAGGEATPGDSAGVDTGAAAEGSPKAGGDASARPSEGSGGEAETATGDTGGEAEAVAAGGNAADAAAGDGDASGSDGGTDAGSDEADLPEDDALQAEGDVDAQEGEERTGPEGGRDLDDSVAEDEGGDAGSDRTEEANEGDEEDGGSEEDGEDAGADDDADRGESEEGTGEEKDEGTDGSGVFARLRGLF